MMQLSAAQIASLIQAEIEGDPNVELFGPSKIEEGTPGTITFLGNMKYESHLYETQASAVIVTKAFQPAHPVKATLLRVDDVYAAIAILLEHFSGTEKQAAEISPQAIVAQDANLGGNVFVGPLSIIESGAQIGENCQIHGQVYIGKGVQIGRGTILMPGVRVMDDCEIGSDCLIHSNAVIGSDGFGFAPQPDGSFKKIPQAGKVIVGDHVEIGANCTIDRASIGATIIEDGVKLDNLVHLAHNVQIGKNTVIAAQTGVAGSTKIGKSCMIGGQVGFAGHLKIEDGAQIQAQSGISHSIKTPNQKLFGSPAIDYVGYIKSYSVFKKLPDLYREINRLAGRIKKLEQND